MKKMFAFLLVLACGFILVGCGGGSGSKDGNKVTTVTITGPSTIQVDESAQLTAEAKTKDGKIVEGVTFTWKSSDESSVSVDQTGKVTGKKSDGYANITATTEDGVVGKKSIVVKADSGVGSYPNLGGHVIKIAQADTAIAETDPNNPENHDIDKQAKIDAWKWVEENFNCSIEVVAYPGSAPWGPSRWTYIETQAKAGVSDYDFLTVPAAEIPRFVEAEALINLSDWYVLYGKDSMDPSFKTAGTYKGKLYSISGDEAAVYNVMYYNIGLWNRIKDSGNEILKKEPAEIFNDGNWTYSTFKDYCTAAQAALATVGNLTGTPYAVAGNPVYYWVGMVNSGGVAIADTTKGEMNLQGTIETQAAQVLKDIHAAGAMDPNKLVDGSVTPWNNGSALFNTGDLWFVNAPERWKEDLWGAGDLTQYGYVPFPMPDTSTKDTFKVGLSGGEACWVMPIGRDYSDSSSSECTPENIYYAMMMYYQKSSENFKGSASYDDASYRRQVAERVTESEASIQAFMWVNERIKTIGFFDPMADPGNNVSGGTYSSTFATRVSSFIYGKTYTTWVDAMEGQASALKENLVNNYGGSN